MPPANGIGQYQNVGLSFEHPHKLVSLLYDRAVRSIQKAKEAFRLGNRVTARSEIMKAVEIITELSRALDMKRGGVLAYRLEGLYDHICIRLIRAAGNQSQAFLDETLRLLIPIQDAWNRIQPPTRHVPRLPRAISKQG